MYKMMEGGVLEAGKRTSTSPCLQRFLYEDTDGPPVRRTRRATSNRVLDPSAIAIKPPSSEGKRKRKRTCTSPPPSTADPPQTPTGKGKRKRTPSGYAPPAKYSHLTNKLRDSLGPDLITVFIGVNPGIRTATLGHAYAHPSNLFWKLCYKSGCTPRLCTPQEDGELPDLYALGHTNIVTRPTKDASELSAEEMGNGVAVLEDKVRRWRPESVCLVGKSIWETVFRIRKGRKMRKEEFRYGWQDEGENMGLDLDVDVDADNHGRWKGARVFVATTTSGLAAGMRPHEKEEVWKVLGEFVARRRRERGIPDEGGKIA